MPSQMKPTEPKWRSRVSRKGLPCPEIWDTHVPQDENDMRGFITIKDPFRNANERRLFPQRRLVLEN